MRLTIYLRHGTVEQIFADTSSAMAFLDKMRQDTLVISHTLVRL